MKVIIDIFLRDGVLDPEGQAVENSLKNLGFDNFKNIRIGKQIILDIEKNDEIEVIKEAKLMCEKVLSNTVIENYKINIFNNKKL